ncbi:glycosyltransferase family 2 protein [Nonomuraea rubra]|uniref:glycosyltransferase family 2 protein n=1 Tax=Nonomuraea rubra TaxID=46180 RepID=UPI00360CA639
MTTRGRVRGNDYRVLAPGEHFTPRLTVSVVIPAYGGQDKLDLVLAALGRQTYPAALTEIIVVDNGSSPPLRLPEGSAARLVVCDRPGRASARNAGLAQATGDVVHWLDSDVVLTPGAIEAHMRWHHAAPYLVVTGYIRFTAAELPAELPDDLAGHFEPAEPHAWIVDLVERTDGLTDNPQRPFSLHVGGATSVSARLIEAAGPMDEELILGQDTELGYRLGQAGAVFVPEPAARAYHLGPTMRMRDKQPIDRVSHAFVADRIPAYRWLRGHPGRQWKVPYVTVVVDGTRGYDAVRTTVDAVLAGTVPDVSVLLTGPWPTLDRDRRAPSGTRTWNWCWSTGTTSTRAAYASPRRRTWTPPSPSSSACPPAGPRRGHPRPPPRPGPRRRPGPGQRAPPRNRLRRRRGGPPGTHLRLRQSPPRRRRR